MTKRSWRARLREGAISFLALVALVSILYVADFRVRREATRVINATSPMSVGHAGTQFNAEASRLVANARDRATQNAAITGFVATAGVLLLFMLKT
jgi:hypothetical protein